MVRRPRRRYFAEILACRCRYLHSEIETLERVRILRDLRRGEFDVLIGINLLREGLDLPEVSLVAVLDADKEGYLRSATALIQTIGRCARHINGRAILYADRITGSMRQAMDETSRRRVKQLEYNEAHGITPQSIVRPVDMRLAGIVNADYVTVPIDDPVPENITTAAELRQGHRRSGNADAREPPRKCPSSSCCRRVARAACAALAAAKLHVLRCGRENYTGCVRIALRTRCR